MSGSSGASKTTRSWPLGSIVPSGGEQCIELGHWAGTALDSSFLLPQEDMRRKKDLECLSMLMRYSADARLRRVARIVGNQIHRLAAYLRTKPPVANAQTFETMWELMPHYNIC